MDNSDFHRQDAVMGKNSKSRGARDWQAIERELQALRLALSSAGKQLSSGELPYAQFIHNRLGAVSTDSKRIQQVRDVCDKEEDTWLKETTTSRPNSWTRFVLGRHDREGGGDIPAIAQTSLDTIFDGEPPDIDIVFSSDGKKLVSGSQFKRLQMWDSSTGIPQHNLHGYSYSTKVAFDPSGTLIAFALIDGTIRLCDSGSGHQHQILEHEGVSHLVFSHDGRFLASSSRFFITSKYLDCEFNFSVGSSGIRLWNPLSNQPPLVLDVNEKDFSHLAFSPDGKHFAAATSDGIIKLWDPDTGLRQPLLDDHQEAVTHLVFSPDGKHFAAATSDGIIKLWDPDTGLRQPLLNEHQEAVTHLVFSPDGKHFAAASLDGTFSLWDLGSKPLSCKIWKYDAPFGYIAFSPDGRHIALASADGHVVLCDPFFCKKLQLLAGHSAAVLKVAFSPDGKRIASASRDGSVRVCDASFVDMAIPTEKLQTRLIRTTHTCGCEPLPSLSPDGRLLVSTSGNYEMEVFDTDTGECINVFNKHKDNIIHITFTHTPDGYRVASASRDGVLYFWNPYSDSDLATKFVTDGKADNLSDFLAVSSDGQRIAWGMGKSVVNVCLWQAGVSKPLTTIRGSNRDSALVKGCGIYEQIFFSPRGDVVALVMSCGYLRLCRSINGETLAIMVLHGDISHCAFSPQDGRLIALVWSGSILLWNRDDRILLKLQNYAHLVKHIAFSPDGSLLASCTSDGLLSVWHTSSGCLLITEYDLSPYRIYWYDDMICVLENIGGYMRVRRYSLTSPMKTGDIQMRADSLRSERASCFRSLPERKYVRRFHSAIRDVMSTPQ